MTTTLQDPRADGVQCDNCHGTDFAMLHEWPVGNAWNQATIPFAVWRCARCELVMLYPVPQPEHLPDAGDWWSTNRKETFRRPRMKALSRKIRYSVVGNPVYRMIKDTARVARSGKLLDVGCGEGQLLDEAKAFYEPVGLEPSPIAAAKVRERGFEVIESTLEDAAIAPGSFDVVTMDGVIEHVASPVDVLKKINAILRPGGVVVMKTPKFNGPTYRYRKAEWNGFRHGYHTFLFTAETLGNCMEQAGFAVVERPKRNGPLDDILVLWGKKTREVSPAM